MNLFLSSIALSVLLSNSPSAIQPISTCYYVLENLQTYNEVNLQAFAENVCASHMVIVDLLEKSECFYATDSKEWIKGITFIVAGLILIRYPPPARTLGIRLIKRTSFSRRRNSSYSLRIT